MRGAKAGAIEPEELAKVPLLLRERGSGSRRVVERALKKVGLPLRSLRVAMELDSTEAIISGVEAELGVGFVSRWAVGKVLRLGTVRIVAVEGMEILRDFSFVRLAGTEVLGTAAAFQRFAMGSVSLTRLTGIGNSADKKKLSVIQKYVSTERDAPML